MLRGQLLSWKLSLLWSACIGQASKLTVGSICSGFKVDFVVIQQVVKHIELFMFY